MCLTPYFCLASNQELLNENIVDKVSTKVNIQRQSDLKFYMAMSIKTHSYIK